jgi:hypothetical protein
MPPLHDFLCPNGHVFEKFQPLDYLREFAQCPHCDLDARKVFLSPPGSFVRMDYRYESPVSGRPITSYREHMEELARNDSVVYEPGIKQDQERNERMREQALDRAIDETVEREIATMPAVKRERLTAELEGGMSAEAVRITPPQQSFRKQA